MTSNRNTIYDRGLAPEEIAIRDKAELEQIAAQRLMFAQQVLHLDHVFWGNLSCRLRTFVDWECETAWADGVRMGFNPLFILGLHIQPLVGLRAHEVAHCFLLHSIRRKGRTHKELWQIAVDVEVNRILLKSGFVLPEGGIVDSSFGDMVAEEIYEVLYYQLRDEPQEFIKWMNKQSNQWQDQQEDEQDASANGSPAGSSGQGQQEDDQDASANGSPDDSSGQDQQEDDQDASANGSPDDNPDPQPIRLKADPGRCGEIRDLQEEDGSENIVDGSDLAHQWNMAVHQASSVEEIVNASDGSKSSPGTASGNLTRLMALIEAARISPLEFSDIIDQHLMRSGGWNYKRPHKAFAQEGLFMPEWGKKTKIRIGMAFDTSGSIDKEFMLLSAMKLQHVLDKYDAVEVVTLFCDTAVHESDPLVFTKADMPFVLTPTGGGGTDFKPVFNWFEIHQEHIDILVYFTDLCVERYHFPATEPDYPVIWGLKPTRQKFCTPPWGTVVPIMHDYQ